MRGPRTTRVGGIHLVLAAALGLWGNVPAQAGWEMGIKGAADSNVTRSVRDGTADTFLYGSLGYSRDVPGDRRLDWTVVAMADGALYGKVADLNYASLTVAPGIVYVPRAGWTLTLSPFLLGKNVSDDNQSAVAWGVRFDLQQQLGSSFYLGEHYAYTDSKAREDVFSYQEHALGATAGYSWTPSLSTEIGYQYTRGDSFRTLDSSDTVRGSAARYGTGGMGTGGMGDGGHHGIQDLGGEVAKEAVNTHELSATVGYSWAEALTSYLGYTLASSEGRLGTSRSHIGFLGVGYRFH